MQVNGKEHHATDNGHDGEDGERICDDNHCHPNPEKELSKRRQTLHFAKRKKKNNGYILKKTGLYSFYLLYFLSFLVYYFLIIKIIY